MRMVAFSSLQGLTLGLGIGLRTPEMEAILAQCDSPGRLPDQVPVERFGAALKWLAQQRFSALPPAQALERVGAAVFLGYRQTILGQVQLAALRLIGPDRFLRRVPAIFARTTNFGERTVEQVGSGFYRIHFRGVPLPGSYYCGMVREALRATGAENVTATFVQLGPEDMDFDVHFEPAR